jgi:hypothetical protein
VRFSAAGKRYKATLTSAATSSTSQLRLVQRPLPLRAGMVLRPPVY